MSARKAAVAAHTGTPTPRPVDCPMSDAQVDAQLSECIRGSRDLSRAILTFLGDLDRDGQATWVARSVEAGRVIFQPWAMEILFVLAVTKRARYSELQKLLGISSRTLSDKLQTLREENLVDRHVFDEQPVRIEYLLTEEGRTAAALATPLFSHLNRRTSTPSR